MDYGFALPGSGPLTTPEALTTLARQGEELGFSYIGVGDHVVLPRDVRSKYPYTETGVWPSGQSGGWLEHLTVLSFLASQTSTVRLLTTVTILPYRSPVYTAKAMASIDVLSGGRLIAGVGVGWLREEFEALGTPPFDERGAVSDEYIRAFVELWTSDNPTFKGKYTEFSNIYFEPKPVQRPHPPIWVGGESPPAMRRAAQLGNVWYPTGNNPKFPLHTPEQFAEAVGRLHGYAEAHGRDPSEVGLAYSAGFYDEQSAQRLPNGERLAFTGGPEQIAGDIRAFGELGVRDLMVRFRGDALEERLERMEYFTREIRPLVG